MKTKQCLLVTVVGVSLFVALMNLPAVLGVARNLIGLVLPIIAGSILALFISVPMNGIKKQMIKAFHKTKQPPDKLVHILSFILTLCAVFLVLFFVLTLLLPEIVQSTRNLYEQIEAEIPQWLAYLDEQQINAEWLEELLSELDEKQILQHITQGVDTLLPNVVNALTSTVSGLTTAAFAMIISIYMTLGKEGVCRHARKLVCAYLKPAWAKGILHFCQVFQRTFTKFLTGQCTEALILGTLMFAAFKILAIVRKWGDRALTALQTPLVCGFAHSEIFHHPISGLKPFVFIGRFVRTEIDRMAHVLRLCENILDCGGVPVIRPGHIRAALARSPPLCSLNKISV